MRAMMILAALALTACGGSGGGGSPPSVPPAANAPPTVSVGPAQHVTNGATVQLDGGGTDPEGSALTYQWSLQPQQPGSSAALVNADTSSATFIADSRTPGSSYIAMLRVSDGVTQAFGSVVITASPEGLALFEQDSGGVDQPVTMPFVTRPTVTANTPDPLVTLARYKLIVRGVGTYTVQNVSAAGGLGAFNGLASGQVVTGVFGAGQSVVEFSLQAGHTNGATVQTGTMTFSVDGQPAFDYRATLTTN